MTDLAIRDYTPADFEAVRALWQRCGLVRPWNDPAADIALCLDSGHGAVLVAEAIGESGGAEKTIIASVMVGHDGHRGWVYYLAVDLDHGRRGLGRKMMAAAEQWLTGRGLPKIHLMVRAENERVAAFYRRLGYLDGGTRVFERWLKSPKHPKPAPSRIETVITYLEMTAPPPPRPPRQPHHQLALLRLTDPSVAFYRYLYTTVGEPWFWYERRLLSDEELAARIGAKGIEISVLYADGEPAGYIEMDYSDAAARAESDRSESDRSKSDRSKSGVNIAYFGLVPHFVGHGLGGFFLARAVDEAWRRGPRRLWVHTCTLDHPRALRLYQRTGFVPYKQETKVIDDPRALGLIPATVPLPPAAKLVGPA